MGCVMVQVLHRYVDHTMIGALFQPSLVGSFVTRALFGAGT